MMLLDGLHTTAFKRYLKLKVEMQGAETTFKPQKRVRTA
jgi:hypothetical protein